MTGRVDAMLANVRKLLGIEIRPDEKSEIRIIYEPKRLAPRPDGIMAIEAESFFGAIIVLERGGMPISIVAPADLPDRLAERISKQPPLREVRAKIPLDEKGTTDTIQTTPAPAGEGNTQ